MNKRRNNAVTNRGDADGGDDIQVDQELLNKLMTPQKQIE